MSYTIKGTDCQVIEVLPGQHVSPETAYVVEDYPYGFRLRCKMRYWLDCNPKHGVRLVSQTTNPKRTGEVWNKPKASTYARFGGAMFLDQDGHVKWSGLSEYSDGAECAEWREVFGAGVPEATRGAMDRWCDAKARYQAKLDAGTDWRVAGREVAVEIAREASQPGKDPVEAAAIRAAKAA